MVSEAVKELWSMVSKHGGTINRIYGFSGAMRTPYQEADDPILCILTVAAKNREIGFVFNNGDGAHSWKRIRDYICEGHRKNTLYINEMLSTRIQNLILSLYNGEPIGTKHGRVKKIMSEPIIISDDGVELYDFRENNLFPAEKRIPIYKNGYLASEEDHIRAQFNGKAFFTEYDPRLYAGICRSAINWKVNPGTRDKEIEEDNPMLVCMVSDLQQRVAISFAEIVCQYHQNLNGLADIEPRRGGYQFAEKLIANHWELRKNGLVCDHLTEDRANNYSWALAIVPEGLNKNFGNRSAIAKPYFFFTIFDKKSLSYRVTLGFDDGTQHWERRYSFIGLDEQRGQEKYLYKEIFKAFKDKISPTYAQTDGETFLRKWSAPDRVHDKGNLLTATLGASPFIETSAYSFNTKDLDELPRPCSVNSSC